MLLFVNFLGLLILGGVGVFLIWFGWLYLQASTRNEALSAKLQGQGNRTQAEIVNRRTAFGRRYVGYYITYKYAAPKPDGQIAAYTSEDAIHGDDYRRLNLGDHIMVSYLADDPKTVRIVSGARPVFTAGSYRVGGIVIIGLGVATAMVGVALFVGVNISDSHRAATATADELRLEATPNENQKTATAQAAAATRQADETTVKQIRATLSPRMADWKRVTDRAMHRVLPPETDLNLDEVEIDYGYCASGHFYTYVWTRVTDRLNLGYEIDTFFDGYGYVEGSQPPNCYPKELAQVWLRDSGELGEGWFAVSGATEVKTK